MISKPKTPTLQPFGAKIVFVFILLVPAAGLAGEPPKPPPDPANVKDATKALADKTAQLEQGTKGMEQSIKNGMRELEKLEQGKEMADLKAEAKKANDKIKEAAKVVEQAMDASLKCNKEKFAELDEKANKLLEEARQAMANVEKMDKDLVKKMDAIILKVDDNIENLKKSGDKEYKDAQDAGLPKNSPEANNFQQAKQALDKELKKQLPNLKNLDKANSRVGQKINDIRSPVNRGRELDHAETELDAAEKNIKANCPMRLSSLPGEPADVYVSVDNRPEVLACIVSGQNPDETATALGFAEHQLVARSPAGIIIRGPGDPETVNRLAQQRKITLCFPAEANVCMIMTPLTAFRGHNHEAHIQSNRAIHDHEAPDPPWEWGVTPPETAIRWD
jgi:hypothetical protein